jgi:hypothetical protein
MGHKAISLAVMAGVLLSGCVAEGSGHVEQSAAAVEHAAGSAVEARRQYGGAARIGNGTVRTYVTYGGPEQRVPLEIGIAIDAAGMEGLSTEMQMMHLDFPAGTPAPYRFAMFGWNPDGHEPDHIYTLPHFDFHFYFTSHEAVDAMVPSNPDYATRANRMPAEETVPPFFVVPAPPGVEPGETAVPQMGVHWVDVRTPELQGLLGNPDAAEPFTRTFIYGSWDGRFTFLEPMITRAHLLSKPDEIIPVSQPERYGEAGWYPDSYRIRWDPQTGEYLVALTGLSWFE